MLNVSASARPVKKRLPAGHGRVKTLRKRTVPYSRVVSVIGIVIWSYESALYFHFKRILYERIRETIPEHDCSIFMYVDALSRCPSPFSGRRRRVPLRTLSECSRQLSVFDCRRHWSRRDFWRRSFLCAQLLTTAVVLPFGAWLLTHWSWSNVSWGRTEKSASQHLPLPSRCSVLNIKSILFDLLLLYESINYVFNFVLGRPFPLNFSALFCIEGPINLVYTEFVLFIKSSFFFSFYLMYGFMHVTEHCIFYIRVTAACSRENGYSGKCALLSRGLWARDVGRYTRRNRRLRSLRLYL